MRNLRLLLVISALVLVLIAGAAQSRQRIRPISIERPPTLTDADFVGVDNLEHYAALHLREGESAQEFFFDDLMGLTAERVEDGYMFSNRLLDVKDTVLDEEFLSYAEEVGAKPYVIDDGNGALLLYRNAFHSTKPGDPHIGASAFYTADDTNLCGYVAISYVYNGLTGNTTLSPMEVILAQTTLPAGRGMTTFFPALPPLSLHLGGITPRDLAIVADLVLKDTPYTAQRVVGQLGNKDISDTIQKHLVDGLPVIAFVNIVYEGGSDGFRADVSGTLDPEGTYGHFVVVTGYAEQDGEITYRIRNPYDNRVEYYSEDDFISSVIQTDDEEYGASLILFKPRG